MRRASWRTADGQKRTLPFSDFCTKTLIICKIIDARRKRINR
jgi:hypothetical protein